MPPPRLIVIDLICVLELDQDRFSGELSSRVPISESRQLLSHRIPDTRKIRP